MKKKEWEPPRLCVNARTCVLCRRRIYVNVFVCGCVCVVPSKSPLIEGAAGCGTRTTWCRVHKKNRSRPLAVRFWLRRAAGDDYTEGRGFWKCQQEVGKRRVASPRGDNDCDYLRLFSCRDLHLFRKWKGVLVQARISCNLVQEDAQLVKLSRTVLSVFGLVFTWAFQNVHTSYGVRCQIENKVIDP